MEPSHLPVAIQLVRDGQALPTKEVEGEEGPTTVALLEGVAAGSSGAGGKPQLWAAVLPRPVQQWCPAAATF